MSDGSNTPLYQEEEIQSEDIKKLIFRYLRYWKWFILCIFLALVLAFLYNRYSHNVYHTDADIKVLKDKSSGIDLTGLPGAGTLFDAKEVNLENEKAVLTSRKLLDSVVDNLKLNTLYYREGRINSNEVWGKSLPFHVQWFKVDSVIEEDEELPLFKINFSSKSEFVVGVYDGEASVKGQLSQPISMVGYKFMVTLNPGYEGQYDEVIGQDYTFKHISQSAAIDQLLVNLKVTPVGEDSDILNLSYQGSTPPKSEDILNTLIKKFNQDGIRDKQLVSKRTKEFVEKRLKSLTKELDTVEMGLVDYKQSYGVVTLESTAQQLFGKEAATEQKRIELNAQIKLAAAFKDELINGKEYSLLPASLVLESQSISSLTEQYNEAVQMRYDLLNNGATPMNPQVLNLENTLDNIKSNIITSIGGYVNSLELSLQKYKKREKMFAGRLNRMPKVERGTRGIKRQQKIKETLYLFLLQKREEAALKYATTPPTIKVVDYAYTNPIPIAPKKKIIYLAALILGLLIPFGILYVKFLLDTKINSKEVIERQLPELPVLAEIPEIDKNTHKLIKKNDRSVLAEAFRILRTNLFFFNGHDKSTAKVVYVTSTTKGEGKTFTALNMANSLALTGKKTLVIGCDLRNPQTHNYYGLDKNHLGVSAFLSDPSLEFDDLIFKNVGHFENLDLIISGSIPPNPAELLMSDRFEVLLNQAKEQYDYVIVDTAPTILVTDTLLISRHADLTLYMTRAGVTETRLLAHIEKLHKDKKLNKIGIVLNGLSKKSGYGYSYSYNYGYGYGYSEATPAAWWKFWK